ncbi:hypothetical protein JR316_0007487 [Psilocybe cubensis]|uniref:Uncharacterized protein n=2 Tax=Psilocybe cubensis TaxID=181762 RepID=A0A8H8CHB4_PSICU|nr:hypothetical protein JR316_0007487 [Psilocybe cubensis]KAH9480885.1 hypothetical protein JR316_0007487 [Psilocybe cubensis]
MTEVAIHPRVALLRGYPKQRKGSSQQPYSAGLSKHIDSVKLNRKVPNVVTEWAQTPRLYKPAKQEKEYDFTPPFRRNITDFQDLDISTYPSPYDIEDTEPSVLDHGASDTPANEDDTPADSKTENYLRSPSFMRSPEACQSYDRKFLSEFINLCTGHDTSSEYPRGHQYADRSQDNAPVTRPSSRLGFNREQSSALDCLQHIAAKIDEEKRRAILGKSHRYRREALVYGEDDEQDITDLGLTYSDEDEEEDVRLLFAKTINSLDSVNYTPSPGTTYDTIQTMKRFCGGTRSYGKDGPYPLSPIKRDT